MNTVNCFCMKTWSSGIIIDEQRGTLPGAPLLFFAFSSPYSQLISLMVADEKVKGYFIKGRGGGGS